METRILFVNTPLLSMFLWTAVITPSRLLAADDLQGAEAVLRAAAEASAKPQAKKEEESPQAALRREIREFGNKAGSLPAAEAAEGWLKLVDQVLKLGSQQDRRGREQQPLSGEDLMRALPPPPAWQELGKAIEGRPPAKGNAQIPEFGLKLLVQTLNRDAAGREQTIAQLQAAAEAANEQEKYFYRNVLDQLSRAILAASEDPASVLKALERELRSHDSRFGVNSIEVPNLVVLVGADQAEAFLRRAIVAEKTTLQVEPNTATHRLAQKLALELIENLKSPQWQLVSSLDSVELYEALQKRFDTAKEKPAKPVGDALLPGIDVPEPDYGESYQKQSATLYYLLGLIAGGRANDAVNVARNLPGRGEEFYLPQEALKSMEAAGYTTQLDDFFHELLSKSPELPFWFHYVQLAAKAGRTERMLTLARTIAANDQLSRNKRANVHEYLFSALLAADQVDEGVKEIQRLIAIRGENGPGGDTSRGAASLGLTLARLGVLLTKPEWIDEGVEAVRRSVRERNASRRYFDDHSITECANLLTDLKRAAEAEGMLRDGLAAALRPDADAGYSQSSAPRTFLMALADLYHKLGRHADVVLLLDRAAYWGAKDLSGLWDHGFPFDVRGDYGAYGRGSLSVRGRSLQMPYIAAEALAATGRKAEAARVVDALLDANPNNDGSFELFLRLAPENAVGRLDHLFSRDPFEERPLIWKAELLRRQNQLAEAEKVARQAISIDPSDGEQGPGNRMRVYAVLADIRAARGDQKEADFLRGAVKAIRLAETADRYYEAGLLKRAVKMYQDSLTHFADAYCIQSRLAVQLAELGQHQAAEAHYRRAYELMPDSFGRVESHCFGCERAFDGQRAQSLAERVFTELAAKTPNKPQVHYLLGYLRFEQERHADALPHFRTAVRLDADYLNAWAKIDESLRHVRLAASERDNVALNILRLDPLGRHKQPNLEGVTNLRELWNIVDAALRKKPAVSTNLYELAASKAALEKREADPAYRSRNRFDFMGAYQYGRYETPGDFISQNGFVAAAKELIAPRYGRVLLDE